MATLPKVLINRADYQIGGGVALRLRTQARLKPHQRIFAPQPLGGLWKSPGVTSFARRQSSPFCRLRKELRRIKRQEDLEEFSRFEALHGKAVCDEVLKPRREAAGNAGWQPNWTEGPGGNLGGTVL
jgi:hypothetical protein